MLNKCQRLTSPTSAEDVQTYTALVPHFLARIRAAWEAVEQHPSSRGMLPVYEPEEHGRGLQIGRLRGKMGFWIVAVEQMAREVLGRASEAAERESRESVFNLRAAVEVTRDEVEREVLNGVRARGVKTVFES